MKSLGRLHIAPASFWIPEYLPQSAWQTHAPFAFWLMQAVAPRRIVDVGAGPGLSFFVFCQAVRRLGLAASATAVTLDPRDPVKTAPLDTYADFARVLPASGPDAAIGFEDGSVDLLHLDSEADHGDLQRLFDAWRPKLSGDAVVLVHDLRGGTDDAGAMFEELSAESPSFRFDHGLGLGIVCPQANVPDGLRSLLDADVDEARETRKAYRAFGDAVRQRWYYGALRDGLEALLRADADLSDEGLARAALDAGAPVLARVGAKIAAARSGVDPASPTDPVSDPPDPAEPIIALLRRSLKARRAELERLQQALRAKDPRSDLLRSAYASLSERLERDRDRHTMREEELVRWGRGRKAGLEAVIERLEVEIQARSDAEARLRDLERSRVVRATRRVRRWLGRQIAPTSSHAVGSDLTGGEQAIRNTGLFDEAYYRATNPDLGDLDATAHFAATGWWEGRRPNPTFDPVYYLATNGDVRRQDINPLVHYADQGIVEGRSPSHVTLPRRFYAPEDAPLRPDEKAAISAILETGLFDEVYYRSRYPDIDEAGLEPVVHFALEGWKEGRRPNAGFDPLFYCETYPDVGRSGLDPLVHYATAGIVEGRMPCAEAMVSSAERSGDDRLVADLDATGLFDSEFYHTSNPDIASSGQDPALHFMTHGWREGRWPNAYFDPAYYLEHNPDVRALGLNPLLHYAESGMLEGRRPAASAPTQAADSDYDRWVAAHDTLTEADRRAMRARLKRLTHRPLISIILPAYNTRIDHLSAAIASVRSQIYENWELCIADDASPDPAVRDLLRDFAHADYRIKLVERRVNGHISAASNSAIELATGEFLALLDHDDVIPDHALFEVVYRLNQRPDLDLIYSDEDHLDPSGRRKSPYFKSAFNPDLMLGHNMISHLGVYRTSLVRELGGFRLGFEGSQDYDLALRVIDATTPDKIAHIPAILYHWRSTDGEATFSQTFQDRCVATARQALMDHLARRGEAGTVVAHPLVETWHRVRRPVPEPAPLVSIIVPTKDKAEILAPCCAGILERTDYPNFELIVVDHQSTEPETLALLAELAEDARVRILPYDGAFNYSAINNAAVHQARGSVLAFLNNDVDIIAPDWLSEMVALACLPDVGAVGAKLLYPDDRVQHAGVVLGAGGVAGHAFHLRSADDPGDMGRAAMTMAVSAVTGACLVVERRLFEAVGGFDADDLAVAFNDVDLCIKLRETGVRNVLTPYALLYHHESLSRGSDVSPEKQARFSAECAFMINKWGDLLAADPFYNPNFSMSSADYALAWPPRRRKPWMAAPPT